MSISFIIISFNTKKLLEKCLESIKNQSRGGEIQGEIIVVDNGSQDGSAQAIKKLPSKQFADCGLTVHLIENKENLGFAKAVNQAIKKAKSDNLLLLNSDTQLTKNSLQNLLEFEEKVRPSLLGSQLLNPDGSIQPSCFHLSTVKRAFLEYWLGKKGFFSKYYPLGNEPSQVEAVSGGAMLIPKEIIEKIGPFDERYFMYYEDLDFCRRVRKAGFKIYYLPSSKIIHEHGSSGKKLTSPETQWRRLIPSSKIYHGLVQHYLITAIIWSAQKLKKVFRGT
ncbi:MAG TPA: glycosyltransferase family 2 protein [Clostridia bacterium]|nr:glycosyltransferase family 2 protein [Clostridia bacterium]